MRQVLCKKLNKYFTTLMCDNNIQWDKLFYRCNTNILLKVNQRRPCIDYVLSFQRTEMRFFYFLYDLFP